MKIFLCENCKHKQHQCYICGVLEPSDGEAAKVWHCKDEGLMVLCIDTPKIFKDLFNTHQVLS
jgi:hypothetical protein